MTAPAPPIPEDQLLAYFEGSLPDDAARLIAAQLAHDPAARAMIATWSAQNDALATVYPVAGDAPIPARLTNVIAQARAATPASRPWLRIAAAVALLSVGIGTGWLMRDLSAGQPVSVLQTALLAHETYVTDARHAVEVPASDAAHMNTWMSRRLGRDMQPPDLSASGFTLLGGRVLPDAGGAAAAQYMYEDATGQRVTLYILPRRVEGTGGQFAADGVTSSYGWTGADITCAVVGDIPRAALERLASTVWDQLI